MAYRKTLLTLPMTSIRSGISTQIKSRQSIPHHFDFSNYNESSKFEFKLVALNMYEHFTGFTETISLWAKNPSHPTLAAPLAFIVESSHCTFWG